MDLFGLLFYRCGRFCAERRALGFVVAFAAIALAFPWLPLLQHGGYELATALSVLVALAGYPFGIRFARLEQSQTTPRPLLATAATVLLTSAALAPSLLVTALKTRLTTPCSPLFASHYFLLLLVPSIVVVSALSNLIGSVTRRWLTAAAMAFGVVVLSATHTLWPIVFGPQVYAYNHLAGFLPGPLYDEVLLVPQGLYWFQLATLLMAASAGALFCWRLTKHGLRLGVLLGSLALLLELDGVSLGFRSSTRHVQEVLGQSATRGQLVLHFPIEWDAAQRERYLDDVTFRFAQVSSFLGEIPSDAVQVFIYRSADEKQRLVGAATTQFAKPWRHEVHINAGSFPHPVIKHELVHAMAASWSKQMFRVPTAWLVPHVGLIEGLAVAADNPVDDLTLSQWAAAMKQKGLLPPVADLMQPQGFYRVPASRAYVTAGAFVRYLHQRFGAARLKVLYQQGDFDNVYALSLSQLAVDFEKELDSLQLDESAVNAAFARFSRGSLFDRSCAREAAALEASLAVSSPLESVEVQRALTQLQPNEASHVWTLASALNRLGGASEAQALLQSLLIRSEGASQTKAETLLQLAEFASDEQAQQQTLAAVLALEPSAPLTRTAAVRLAGLRLPALQKRAVASYFRDSEVVSVLMLSEALRDFPTETTVAYLLGRRLFQGAAFERALAPLKTANGHENQFIRREAVRLFVEAAFQNRQCQQISEVLAPIQASEPVLAERLNDFAARCEFLSRKDPRFF